MGAWSWPWASFSSVPAWPTSERDRAPQSRPHSTRWPTRPRHKLHGTCGRRNLFQLSSKVHTGTERTLSFKLLSELLCQSPGHQPSQRTTGGDARDPAIWLGERCETCASQSFRDLNNNSKVPTSARRTRKCSCVPLTRSPSERSSNSS